jgi:hypothetical protein
MHSRHLWVPQADRQLSRFIRNTIAIRESAPGHRAETATPFVDVPHVSSAHRAVVQRVRFCASSTGAGDRLTHK